tara:strand:+ start:1 stop:1248 length:1248 start_codon:yes stop_codon:yes gene_type:complete
MQKGDIPKKGEAGEVADDMKKTDVKKMASTKHKGLPKKVKEIIAQELVKELKLNEVKPFIDPKLKSKPNDRIQYVATNDHRYPSEIAFIDTQKGQVVFFNIQRKEVERIAWNKLNSTHWIRPYLEKEFEGFLDGWSPSGKIKYQGAPDMDKIFQKGRTGSRLTDEGKVNELKTGNKINKARAKAHFKQGENIAVVDKKTKDAIRITNIKQIDAFDTKDYVFAYITEGKLTEYGGSDFSKITSLQNFLTTDLDKFEKGLKDSKHKAIYKKARKQFMKVVSDVAWEHSKLHEGKLNEAPVDMNDPFLVQTRIMRHAAKERKALDAILKAQPKVRQYKISFDKYMELLDTQMFLQQDLAEIGKQLKQMWIDMEQEAEPEGGPKADQYGRDLMKLEAEYKKLKAKLDKVDARVGKYAMY